jgi:hypothetical protein
MSDTFTVHNPTLSSQRLEFLGPMAKTHIIEPGASIELPMRLFRAVFHVRCTEQPCRELGFCTRAHPGAIEGGMAPALTYSTEGEIK